MKRISRVWMISVILIQALSVTSWCLAMEPDEEAKRDEAFLAEYNCVKEHFLVKEYFKQKNWKDTLEIINSLERNGFGDRFLSTQKSKVLARIGDYQSALGALQEALEQKYKCRLTAPRIVAAVPDRADEAIILYNIYEIYQKLDDTTMAEDAYRIAKDRLRGALDIPVSNVEQFESAADRFFRAYSIIGQEFKESQGKAGY